MPTTAASTGQRGQLRRADKIMSTQDVDAFLHNAFCGRTATIGADGYPYVAPNLFVWHEGTVYLHTSGYPGHFAANVKHCKRVSFEVDEPGEVFPYGNVECDTSVSYRSVIVFGQIRVLTREDEATAFFKRFMTKYAPAGSWGREVGSFPRLRATIVYAITPESVTGKHAMLPPLDERWPVRAGVSKHTGFDHEG